MQEVFGYYVHGPARSASFRTAVFLFTAAGALAAAVLHYCRKRPSFERIDIVDLPVDGAFGEPRDALVLYALGNLRGHGGGGGAGARRKRECMYPGEMRLFAERFRRFEVRFRFSGEAGDDVTGNERVRLRFAQHGYGTEHDGRGVRALHELQDAVAS